MVELLRKTLLAGALILTSPAAYGAELIGIPRIVDGDTLIIDSARIRLQGIDAPETDQVCLNSEGNRWACGIDARDHLASYISGRSISCSADSTDIYRRLLGTCTLKGEDLNEWMVREGWALAYVKYSSVYVNAERKAQANQRGLWQGAFIAPWDWRHRNNQTVILGAFAVPTNAQAILLAPSGTEGAPSPECTIKGNVTRNSERIYHMPDQRFYAKIDMRNGRGRRWFCTPEEAETAGWRKSLK